VLDVYINTNLRSYVSLRLIMRKLLKIKFRYVKIFEKLDLS